MWSGRASARGTPPRRWGWRSSECRHGAASCAAPGKISRGRWWAGEVVQELSVMTRNVFSLDGQIEWHCPPSLFPSDLLLSSATEIAVSCVGDLAVADERKRESCAATWGARRNYCKKKIAILFANNEKILIFSITNWWITIITNTERKEEDKYWTNNNYK